MKSFDRIAPFYDEDMGQNNNGDDIPFYLACVRQHPGSILEIGCGTGRMTIPFLQSGFRVLGLDSSPAMIHRLIEKKAILRGEEQERLTLLCADVRRPGLRQKFKMVCSAYSLLAYMTSDEDLTAFFQNVKELLEIDGRFVLDVFVPQDRLQTLPNDQLHFDYRRPWKDTFFLERSKQIIKYPGARQNTIRRFYKFLDKDLRVLQEVVTEEKIRLFYPGELRKILTEHGFQIERSWGGFRGEALAENSAVMVFLCSLAEPLEGYGMEIAIDGHAF